MKPRQRREVNVGLICRLLIFTSSLPSVLFICMDASLFRDFLLMAFDLDMINGEYVFVYLDIFRLMRYRSISFSSDRYVFFVFGIV